MKDRIKQLRESLGLSQRAFAARIGLTGSAVAGYELGTREPSGSAIKVICREFNVNEEWLRCGTGEMFNPASPDDELTGFLTQVMSGDDCDPQTAAFRKALVRVMSRMSPSEWKLLKEKADDLQGEIDK